MPANITEGVSQFERTNVDASPLWLRCSLATLLVIVASVSVAGNVCTCVIVYRKRAMRSAINLLLTNIACADILLSVVAMPLVTYNLVTLDDRVTGNVCLAASVSTDAAVGVACGTLLIISADRFFIIVHKRDRLSVWVAKATIVGTWTASVALASLQLLSGTLDTALYDTTACWAVPGVNSESASTGYTVTLVTIVFFLPMVLILYLFASIIRTVQLTSKKVHIYSGSELCVSVTQYSSKLGLPIEAKPCRFAGHFDAKRRAFKTILLLCVTVLFCWLPHMIERMSATTASVPSNSGNRTVAMVFLVFGFSKSALYPVIFCVRNTRFRRACLHMVPTAIKLPKRAFRIRSTRVNPRIFYEVSETL